MRAVVKPVWPRPTIPSFFSRSSMSGVSQKQKSLLVCPAAPVHLFGVVLHLLGDVQDVGKDHLGYGVGAVGGNIGDDDSAFFGGSGVYDVVSGGQHTDILQFGQCRHVLGGEHGFVGQQDFCTSGAFQYFRRGGAVVDGALAQGLQFVPAKVTGVGGIAV